MYSYPFWVVVISSLIQPSVFLFRPLPARSPLPALMQEMKVSDIQKPSYKNVRNAMMRLFTSVTTWFVVTVAAFVALIGGHFATSVSVLKWWADVFAVATNLLAGGLVSFLFYFLVVHVPARRRKAIIKANLQRIYGNIKRDILFAVVQASRQGGRHDLVPDDELLTDLMTPVGFRKAFEGGREADEGFYAFENQMDEATWEFRQIVLNLQMLSKQIEFLLQNYSIENQEAFDFFKRVELLLMRLQANGPGYDESKPLCGFIWEMYTGWNFVEGDTGQDKIQKMISAL